MDELFVAINATSDAEDVYNHKKGFNRQEWIDFLVRQQSCDIASKVTWMMWQLPSTG